MVKIVYGYIWTFLKSKINQIHVKPSYTNLLANALYRFLNIIESTWVLDQTIDATFLC
jgi:hypothetical protein